MDQMPQQVVEVEVVEEVIQMVAWDDPDASVFFFFQFPYPGRVPQHHLVELRPPMHYTAVREHRVLCVDPVDTYCAAE